jgi:hypothetical protein
MVFQREGRNMNKLTGETLITPDQAAATVPGPPLDPGTVRRWHNTGVNGIRLEAIKRGGRLFTSREALERFFARLNAGQPATCA